MDLLTKNKFMNAYLIKGLLFANREHAILLFGESPNLVKIPDSLKDHVIESYLDVEVNEISPLKGEVYASVFSRDEHFGKLLHQIDNTNCGQKFTLIFDEFNDFHLTCDNRDITRVMISDTWDELERICLIENEKYFEK